MRTEFRCIMRKMAVRCHPFPSPKSTFGIRAVRLTYTPFAYTLEFRKAARSACFHQGDENGCRFTAETAKAEPGLARPALRERPVRQSCRPASGLAQPGDDCRGGPAGGRSRGADPK